MKERKYCLYICKDGEDEIIVCNSREEAFEAVEEEMDYMTEEEKAELNALFIALSDVCYNSEGILCDDEIIKTIKRFK